MSRQTEVSGSRKVPRVLKSRRTLFTGNPLSTEVDLRGDGTNPEGETSSRHDVGTLEKYLHIDLILVKRRGRDDIGPGL